MYNILIICGPTAIGKTSLAIDLAKKYNGTLVSADSRQVYKGLDIGTGKDFPHNKKTQISSLEIPSQGNIYTIPEYDMGGVGIWMYDVIDPKESCNVSLFKDLAHHCILHIYAQGKIPILVGGTGLYIDAIVKNSSTFVVPPNVHLRSSLTSLPLARLQELLKKQREDWYTQMNESDKNNPRRLIRKLEIASYGVVNTALERTTSMFTPFWIGLTLPLDSIRDRISDRIENRIHERMYDEIIALQRAGVAKDSAALSSLGYSIWNEAIDQKRSSLTREEKQTWLRDEMRYVKRQLTWFKRYPEIHWADPSQQSELAKVEQTFVTWYTQKDNEHPI